MASLKRTKIIDPSARVNLSFKESTRVLLEQYRLFCEKSHGVGYERSEIAEQVLCAWIEQDKDFSSYVGALTDAQKDAVRRSVIKGDAEQSKSGV